MAMSKEEYLKKYLTGSEKNERKVAKKKKSSKTSNRQTGMKIFDDDVDFKSLLPPNLKNTLDDDLPDDTPVVVDLGLDDRPEKMKELERMKSSKRWKVITQEDDGPDFFQKGRTADLQKNDRLQSGSEADSSPRRKRVDRIGSDDDISPERKRFRKESDFQIQATATRGKISESSLKSHAARNLPEHAGDGCVSRSQRHDSDGSVDPSPPRRRHDSNSDSDDFSRLQNVKPNIGKVSASRRKHSDSDNSPPRQNHQTESDNSPPRHGRQVKLSQRRNNRDNSNNSISRFRNQTDSPSKRDQGDSDNSPPRGKRYDSDNSPPRRNQGDSDNSPPRRNQGDSDNSPPRNRKLSKRSSKSSKTDAQRTDKSEPDVHPPQKNADKIQNTATPDVIYRKDGKKRDLAAEQKAKEKEEAKKNIMAAKYKEWGKGLKQKEIGDNYIADALHEAEKPLARYKDDQDLDMRLRDLDRDGDPMLAFLKKKKSKATGSSRPCYRGPQPPPNRYNLQPGYRWDGVDRSNGFEKKFFSKLSEDKAKKDIAYKWSTEDM